MPKPNQPLILASESPRRKELLRKLKIPLKVIPSRLAEPPPGGLGPIEYTRKLALAKARVVAKQVGTGFILGADTVVVYKDQILGKPADFAQGCQFLSLLQGTRHKVVTAVALLDAATGKTKVAHAVSTVTMRKINPQEITRIARRHLDKAGGYAAQEKKDPLVKKIVGSYTNVVGLPLEIVEKLLRGHPFYFLLRRSRSSLRNWLMSLKERYTEANRT